MRIPRTVPAKIEEEERDTGNEDELQTNRSSGVDHGTKLFRASVFVVHVDLKCWQHYSASLIVLRLLLILVYIFFS